MTARHPTGLTALAGHRDESCNTLAMRLADPIGSPGLNLRCENNRTADPDMPRLRGLLPRWIDRHQSTRRTFAESRTFLLAFLARSRVEPPGQFETHGSLDDPTQVREVVACCDGRHVSNG